jgi:hypothetical protein
MSQETPHNPYAPPTSATETAPVVLPASGPVGLSGWLVLVGLGLVITPFRLAIFLLQTFPPIFRDGTWGTLTTPGSGPYHPLWAPLLIAEMAINLIFIATSLYLLFLFFQKSARFPRLYTLFLLSNLAFLLADAFAVTIVLPTQPFMDASTAREFGRSVFSACIWVPYLFLSKRVKNTFVRTDA